MAPDKKPRSKSKSQMSSRHLRRIRSKSVPSASLTDQDSREPANTVKTEEVLNNQTDETPQSLDPPERKSRRIGGELPLNFDYSGNNNKKCFL